MKVLLNSFHLNGHTLGFHPRTKNLCFLSVGARDVYERAVEFFGEEHADEKLFLAFGKFEENCKEVQCMSLTLLVVEKTRST